MAAELNAAGGRVNSSFEPRHLLCMLSRQIQHCQQRNRRAMSAAADFESLGRLSNEAVSLKTALLALPTTKGAHGTIIMTTV